MTPKVLDLNLAAGKMKVLETVPSRTEGKGEVLLLVDDNESIRTALGNFLDLKGYRVISASGGREALKKAQQELGPIHLLITNVVMPEMNGRELSRHLTTLRPGLKTLFMSGYYANALIQQGILYRLDPSAGKASDSFEKAVAINHSLARIAKEAMGMQNAR